VAAVWEGGKEQRINVNVLKAVSWQVQVADDWCVMDQDVGGATEIETETRHDLLSDYRTADIAAAFHHDDLVAGLSQIPGADQCIMAGANDYYVAVGI